MPARQTYENYTVVKGDTVAKIAARYGTSVGAIASASGLADANKIKVGQVLSIPVPSTYDPDALDEVKVVAQRIAPASVSLDPVAIANAAAEWLKPPKLWITLAVAAGAGYFLLSDRRKRSRR